MLLKTSWRIVVYEKEKFIGAASGVTLGVFLVILQWGFFLGYKRDTTAVLDSFDADIWIAPQGQTTFDGWSHIDDLCYWKAKEHPDITRLTRIVCGYAWWRIPTTGGRDMVQVIGIDFDSNLEFDFGWDRQALAELLRPDGHCLIAEKDKSKLGVNRTRQEGIEILGRKADVVGFVDDIHLFNTAGFVLTDMDNARAFLRLPPSHVTYVAAKCRDEVAVASVVGDLQASLSEHKVLTGDSFHDLASRYWETNTGIGPVLLMSAFLGVVVGFLIVTLTFYISTIEKIPLFASLKAIGASTSDIAIVLMIQVAIVFLVGSTIAGIGLYVTVTIVQETTISIVVTPGLVFGGVGTMLFCSAIGSCLSLRKLVATDPGEAFRT